MVMDYVNLQSEFVIMPMPVLSPKKKNYYTIIQTNVVQLGDTVDCSI